MNQLFSWESAASALITLALGGCLMGGSTGCVMDQHTITIGVPGLDDLSFSIKREDGDSTEPVKTTFDWEGITTAVTLGLLGDKESPNGEDVAAAQDAE